MSWTTIILLCSRDATLSKAPCSRLHQSKTLVLADQVPGTSNSLDSCPAPPYSMGDISAPSDSGTGNVEPILPEAITKGHLVPQNQDYERMTSGLDNHPGLPNDLATSQYTSPPQPGSTPSSTFLNRHGPYNMTSLANTLPMNNYHHGQYQRGVQPRYTAGLSQPMAHHMLPVPQYTGPSPIPMVPQGYYGPQAHHISPYYGAGHLHVNQVGQAMLQRQNIAYYANPIAMGHPHPQYYYHHTAQYPIQIPNMQPVVAPGRHPRVEIGQPASTGTLTHNQPLDGFPLPFSSQKSTHGNASYLLLFPPLSQRYIN